MEKQKAFGIDLGTTTSCFAIFRNGKPEVINDDSGVSIIPSIVSSNQKKILIGEQAKNFMFKNIENTILNTKRFIGLSYDDFEKLNEKFNYEIIKDPVKNIPKIIFKHNGKTFSLNVESISALILAYIKKQLKNYTKEDINDVVITVPADFSQNQAQATRDAAKIAGLNVIRILKEPVAAAIAYGFNKPFEKENLILVFDFGGGTLDISILSFEKDNFEVIYTKGDNHLGGEDFDNNLLKFCLEKCSNEIKDIYSKLDDKKKLKFNFRLKIACEKLKIELSSILEGVINIDNLYNDVDFLMTINRSDFEEVNSDLFKRVGKILKSVFEESKIDKKKITNVLLVGGTSNIPKVKQIVSQFFENKFKFDMENTIDYTIEKDELIAKGAAIQAAIINKMYDKFTFVLFDKYPKAIRISDSKNEMYTVIKQYSYIPIETNKITFKTKNDNQNKFEISIFEGKNENPYDNIKLLDFIVEIPPLPAGKVKIDVLFSIDINSVLGISATAKNNEKIIQNKNFMINLKDEEIQKLRKENEEIMIEDNKEFAKYLNEINSLEKELNETNDDKKKIELLNNKISTFEKFLNDSYKENEFKILQDEYLYILKLFINIYIKFLEIITPSNENEFKYHINKITLYVNKVNFSNISDLFPILQILNNNNINIYNQILINYLEKYYNECYNYFKNEQYENAKDGFNQIIMTFKKYNIEKIGFYSDLENKYSYIINYSNIYLKRILANNLIKLGDNILKNGIDEKNYSLAIQKYNEALNVIKSNDRKDIEYELKCISKILYIKYIYFTNDINKYMIENKTLISIIEQNLKDLDIKTIQKEEWYKEFLIIKNEIMTTKQSKLNNNDELIQQIENNYKNLKTNEFIDFIIKNYPVQGITKYQNIKTDFIKNPKKIILELCSKYNIDRIKEKNSDDDKNKYNIYKTIIKLLNNIKNIELKEK